ncbi:hypothetical protein VSH64_45855 [Amycolatopsis rhabdoformis]|uniref:Secreted protein n=1 Tax=Amycolatopsis rhabdoformis TaxID=1448059 RepID=A0ABZ1I6T6_9PSEU|nr:hypothetical protein [Amycolatopsis rhabdoformis]WSE30042.1 hypothetical protein VSH64_45855 [Amycolatopsis rhabdoformis]
MVRRGLTVRVAAVLAVVVAVFPATPAVSATPPTPMGAAGSWRIDLSTVDDADVNVSSVSGSLTLAGPDNTVDTPGSSGTFITPARRLTTVTGRVSARVSADVPAGTTVDLDVRGRDDTGGWTEWTPAGREFPFAARTVQARISLSGPTGGPWPVVHSVELTASGGTARAAVVTEPLTYRVYATREGLVGGKTSNGHVIAQRDHFVSFPSTKSVSPKGTGSYTAKVCRTDGTRCEFAPVWEVGPWNTHDDYWNPSDERATFPTLPQGTPEAQAAFQDGFNGGKDSRGRAVKNPAGIDLADGVLWDGLGLTGSSWVDVTYLWTGTGGALGVITTAGAPLNLRESPSTSAAIKGVAAPYAQVPIECSVTGESVSGALGTSTLWDRVGPDLYVSDTYVKTGADGPLAPPCP